MNGHADTVSSFDDESEESRIQPAPGALELVRAFVNTVDIEADLDRFTGVAALGDWLVRHDLMGADAPVTEADLRQAVDVREALRALMLANNEVLDTSEALRVLNRAAECARLSIRFGRADRSSLEPIARGVDGALGRLLAIVFAAMIDGTWERLKACHNHKCAWAFYDRSKNRSATWCSMGVCGNRSKARAYRRRRGHAAQDA